MLVKISEFGLENCSRCISNLSCGQLQSMCKSVFLNSSNLSCLLVQASCPILVPHSTAAPPPDQDTQLVLGSAAALMPLS